MRTRQTRVAAAGLEVSRGSLPKDCVIESLVCYELFELPVFALKLGFQLQESRNCPQAALLKSGVEEFDKPESGLNQRTLPLCLDA